MSHDNKTIIEYLNNKNIKFHHIVRGNGYEYVSLFTEGDEAGYLYLESIDLLVPLTSETQFNNFFEFRNGKLVSYSKDYAGLVKVLHI